MKSQCTSVSSETSFLLPLKPLPTCSAYPKSLMMEFKWYLSLSAQQPLILLYVIFMFSRKYQVEVLDQFVIGYLTDSLEHDPVGVYAIAVAYGYNDIGQNAARSCLNLTFSDLRSPYLQYTTGEHISELFRYHVACGEAASALASSDRSWLSPLTNDLVLKTCNSCSVIDCINPISSRSGGHGFHNYDSEDNDMGLLLTTRQNFRPTVCVDSLASFHPHSCTSPKSGSDYSGSICTGDL